MTLLTAVNDAQRELSLAVTSALVGDGQETQNLLYRCAKKEAAEILRRADYDWPILMRDKSFTASLASLQSSGKESNFRRAVEGSFWNTSRHRRMYGPLNPQEWATVNNWPITSLITQYAMFQYDGLHIFPTPTSADTIFYSYIINTPVLAADGTTYQMTFSADTDTYLFGDEILTLGVVWRYLQIKGRDYAEALKEYENALGVEFLAQKGAARALSPAPIEDIDVAQTIPQLPATFG